jgi:hypothetical protein
MSSIVSIIAIAVTDTVAIAITIIMVTAMHIANVVA